MKTNNPLKRRRIRHSDAEFDQNGGNWHGDWIGRADHVIDQAL